MQKQVQKAARQLYPVEKSITLEMLTDDSDGLFLSAMEAMGRVLPEK